MTKKVIIADTNWWISLVIAGFDNQFSLLIQDQNLEICSSEILESEIANSFKKKKLQKYITEETLNLFWISFHLRVKKVITISVVTICRDPKDNFLLELAKDANADYLITGDTDLLVLEKFENTIICTLPDFISKYI